MKPAPATQNEAKRLAALRGLLVLDTPPEQRFDNITAFAADEFDVPIALISLVDAGRQWFKSRVGLEVCETPRDISFCGHAIHGEEVFVVPDAQADTRFADNPLVVGPPFIRFYAGAPLCLSSGDTVGTLCLIDRAPREFDEVDRSILCSLRELVVEELELRAKVARKLMSGRADSAPA